MSDVNKLDSTQCQINPDQYKIKIDTVTAPVGSCPWAIIQVYLGNKLHRSDWDTPNEYMRLTSKKPGNNSVYIEKSDKHGTWFSWQPTPEDLMACDWILLSEVKPVECMLSFDLYVEQGHFHPHNSDLLYGYLADDEFEASGKLGPFGTLTNLKNTTDITKFSYFAWDVETQETQLRVSADKDQVGLQKMKTLFAKDLTITVGSEAYHLGSAKDDFMAGKQQYEFVGIYNNTDASKLGDLLKQNVGNTLHFCFNWK